MEMVLEIKDLEKQYKNFKALNHLNLHIEKGAIYGLIGKNGAGKTTLIRILCGLQKPNSGAYKIYGVAHDCALMSSVRKRMGAIIETPAIYGEMSAKDNLIVQYQIVGNPSLDGIDELLKLVGLANTGKKKAKDFSLGMRQRLAIALALAGNPDFLILDEPINGLDPQGIIEMRELILKLNQERGMTVLISSHYLDELAKIATHYGFLDNGTMIKEISSDKLMKKLEHKISLKTSDLPSLTAYFEEHKIDYEVMDDQSVNVYGKHSLAQFMNELSHHHFIIDEIHEQKESLENYYMNLMGGSEHD